MAVRIAAAKNILNLYLDIEKKNSKFLSYILRHNPNIFNLQVDDAGYAKLEEVVKLVQIKFRVAGEKELREMVDKSPQQRFKLIGNKIRAAYG